jgi:hypothetical protein
MSELETRRRITEAEFVSLQGDRSLSRRHSGPESMGGFVSMYDRGTGRPVFQMRKNLIVLRGRTYALELLFANAIGSQGVNGPPAPYVSDLSRRIITFMVGNGGAPPSDPFNPYAPPPTGPAGVLLASPIPFRFHDTSQSGSGDPSLFIPGDEIQNYADGVLVPGGTPTQFYYWQKNFDVLVPAWYFSESENTVYKAVEMSVTVDDCRTAVGNNINELGLFFGKPGPGSGLDANGADVFVNTEMFSRITFATEFMSTGKSLAIEYRVYA